MPDDVGLDDILKSTDKLARQIRKYFKRYDADQDTTEDVEQMELIAFQLMRQILFGSW